MTFRQIIDVLWQRKWLIVAVVVLAMVVAAGYLKLQVKSYSSTIDARTSVTVTNAISDGALAGVQVDFDTSTITSPKILDKVATLTGSSNSEIANSVSYDIIEDKNSNTIEITAVAPTARGAQLRATSVATVYNEYLQAQIASALKTLTTRAAAANTLALEYEAQTIASPKNVIAAANLSNTLSDLGTLNSEIQTISNAGIPLTVITAAPIGSPVGPGTAIVLAIALAAGLIAGIGIALIRDQFDNRLRGEWEIDPLTGLPSLGELAYDRSLRRKRITLPVASRDQTPLSEGLRSLRTSIQVLLPRERAVVVLTSVEPGDGKTFITANIALAWARAGKSVIVVGGDLRRPTLASYFHDAAEGPGLSELLRVAAKADAPKISDTIEGYLAVTEFPGLRVLAAGHQGEDPADLLATSALTDVVAALRDRADIVIVDSPPAMSLIDASLLAEHADGVIVIASVRRTDRAALAATVDVLKQNGATTLGVVANRSRRGVPKSYSSYYLQSASAKRAPKVKSSSEVPVAPVDDPTDTRVEGRPWPEGSPASTENAATVVVEETPTVVEPQAVEPAVVEPQVVEPQEVRPADVAVDESEPEPETTPTPDASTPLPSKEPRPAPVAAAKSRIADKSHPRDESPTAAPAAAPRARRAPPRKAITRKAEISSE